MEGDDKGIDCVTGGTGFVAPWLIMKLLEHDYTVRTIIRSSNPDKEDKYKYLARIQMVHIDDVTNAHIFLLEHLDADGRCLCSAIDITIDKMCETLSSRYPEYPIATSDALKEIECFTPSYLSSKKLLDTGFKFKYDLEEVYDETIRCCEEKGFL